MKNKTEIFRLVAEIEEWNNRDYEVVKDPNGEPMLDIHCVRARADTIRQLWREIKKIKV